MRAPAALAIYVSLMFPAFAQQSPVKPEISAEWRTDYEHGLSMAEANQWADAAAVFQRAWSTAENDEARAASAISLAHTHRHLKNLKAAALWYDRARTASVNTSKGRAIMATASLNLADLERTFGDYNSAECVLREALKVPLDGKSRIILQNDLADLLRELGRVAEAKPLFENSANSPDATSQNRAAAFIGLADLNRQAGFRDLSVAQLNRALDLSRGDQDSAAEAIELRGLALTWLSSGAPARAEPLFKRSLSLMESAPSAPPEQIATVHIGLGELYWSENKLALAEEEWSRALDQERSVLGEAHPQVGALLEMLADVFSKRGEFDLAIDYATRASIIMHSSFGETSMPLATALTNRAMVEERAMRFDAALHDYETAVTISRRHPEYPGVQALVTAHYASFLRTVHRGRGAKTSDAVAFRLK